MYYFPRVRKHRIESRDAGTQMALLPLQVVLRAFLLGIFVTRIARETVGVLQKLLRGTSTATSRSQWALPDLNGKNVRKDVR